MNVGYFETNKLVFMLDILDVNFKHFYNLRKEDGLALSLNDEIIIFDDYFDNSSKSFNLNNTPPLRINARLYLLCKQGEMTLDVDYRTTRLSKGDFLRLNGQHIIDNIHISNDYQGNGLIFSHDFIMSIIDWIPELKDLVVRADRLRPMMCFNDSELIMYTNIIEELKKKLKATEHAFYNQIARIEATRLVVELANSFNKKVKYRHNEEKETRGEEIFRQFMQLVVDNCKSEHEVLFYANKLNMTSGNLSKAVVNISGRPPIKWIGDDLIAEAKILLRSPGISIQQVSQELNFSDQSSFGKFFKKHTGLTPIEYKRRTRVGVLLQ